MSNEDDPFGLSNDAGRTRIRPVKSGTPATTPQPPTFGDERPAPPPQQPYGGQGYGGQQYGGQSYGQGYNQPFGTPPDPGQRAPKPRLTRANPNPLIVAFASLLELAPELERASPPANAEGLRLRLQDNLIDARDSAVGMGVPMTRANQAAWFVAALVDDIALNTPWGGHSGWPRQPLVVGLTGEVDAGTKFFERLEELLRYPNRDPELLELGFHCLNLGFRGKYRVEGRTGDAALLAMRSAIARATRNPEAEAAPLSPHWQGVIAPDEKPRFAVPLWTIGLAAVAVITALYVGLGIQLSNKATQLYALARPPNGLRSSAPSAPTPNPPRPRSRSNPSSWNLSPPAWPRPRLTPPPPLPARTMSASPPSPCAGPTPRSFAPPRPTSTPSMAPSSPRLPTASRKTSTSSARSRSSGTPTAFPSRPRTPSPRTRACPRPAPRPSPTF